jgi:ribosome maturation factor RimP
MVDLDNIQAIAERVAATYGLEIVDVEMRGGGKHRMLRVVIDRVKPAGEVSAAPAVLGVTHEDCANVSREMSRSGPVHAGSLIAWSRSAADEASGL